MIDLELTGLDPDAGEIISFGAVPIDDARIRLAGAIEGLVRPAGNPTPESIRVHGIRSVDLAEAAPLPEALTPLIAAITGRVLVAHCASVERTFLGRALREQGLRLRGPIVDTAVLASVWLGRGNGGAPGWLSLSELARTLGLPADRPHHALGDALTTAQVFLALATHLDRVRPETVGSLARAGRRIGTPGPDDRIMRS